MPVHRAHPITDPDRLKRFGRPADRPDPEDAVLFDGCERCEEHAAEPLAQLGPSHLAPLWVEMVRVERDPTFRTHYRTVAEGKACRALYRIAVFLERHTDLDPWAWPLRDRAGVR